AVALDVDDDATIRSELAAGQEVGHGLQRAQGLAPPPDEHAEVPARHVDHDGLWRQPGSDLAANSHPGEQLLDDLTGDLALAGVATRPGVGGGWRPGVGGALLDHGDFHDRLGRALTEHFDIDVSATFG